MFVVGLVTLEEALAMIFAGEVPPTPPVCAALLTEAAAWARPADDRVEWKEAVGTATGALTLTVQLVPFTWIAEKIEREVSIFADCRL